MRLVKQRIMRDLSSADQANTCDCISYLEDYPQQLHIFVISKNYVAYFVHFIHQAIIMIVKFLFIIAEPNEHKMPLNLTRTIAQQGIKGIRSFSHTTWVSGN